MAKNKNILSPSAIRTAAAALVLCAIGSAPLPAAARSNEAQTIKDDLGFEFRTGDPPRRIVSLAPNITEILFALGLEDRVAGVTRFCDFPPAAAGKAKVGGLSDLDLEKIRSLEPDLILAFRGNPLEAVKKIRELRLPVFVLDEGVKLEHLLGMITRIGAVTRREAEAAALVRRLDLEMEELRRRLEKAAAKPRVFLLLPGEGLWTCGAESYVHDLLERAGAANIAAGIPRPWAPFSREALLAEDPEVLIVLAGSQQDFETSAGRLRADARLRRLQALRHERLVRLDENKASRFGPRLIEACSDLARALHPECF